MYHCLHRCITHDVIIIYALISPLGRQQLGVGQYFDNAWIDANTEPDLNCKWCLQTALPSTLTPPSPDCSCIITHSTVRSAHCIARANNTANVWRLPSSMPELQCDVSDNNVPYSHPCCCCCRLLHNTLIAAVRCLQRRRDFRQNIQSVFVQLGCGAHAISRRDIQNVTKGVLWARKGRNPAVETGCFCAKRIVLSGGWLRWFDVCWTCNKKADGGRGLDRGCGFIFDTTLSRRAGPPAPPAANAFTLTKDNKGCV